MSTSTATPSADGYTWRRAKTWSCTCLVLAGLTSLLVFAAGVAVGALSFDPTSESGGPLFALSGSPVDMLAEILARNLGAALFLFSGYCTVGVTTIIGLMFTSVWVGAGSHAIIASIGLENVSPDVLLYLPFELAGVLVAATAGLLPLARVIDHLVRDDVRPPHAHSRPALRLALVAAMLICVGAALEVLVIRAH